MEIRVINRSLKKLRHKVYCTVAITGKSPIKPLLLVIKPSTTVSIRKVYITGFVYISCATIMFLAVEISRVVMPVYAPKKTYATAKIKQFAACR